MRVTYFELENILNATLPKIKHLESSESAHRLLRKIVDIL